jgi:hypothetical protein
MVLLAFQMICTSGCLALLAGAAGGTAGTVYVMGWLEDDIHAPVPKVRRAAVAGLKGMSLPILVDKGDQLTAKIESEFSDQKRIWINIESKDDSISHISIRVGMIGDEQRSRRILKALRRHL